MRCTSAWARSLRRLGREELLLAMQYSFTPCVNSMRDLRNCSPHRPEQGGWIKRLTCIVATDAKTSGPSFFVTYVVVGEAHENQSRCRTQIPYGSSETLPE